MYGKEKVAMPQEGGCCIIARVLSGRYNENSMAAVLEKRLYAEDRRSGVDWPIREVPFAGGSITISPQERNGNYQFNPFATRTVMTPGFRNLFHHPFIDSSIIASHVVQDSCKMIHEAFAHPDYLQTFVYEKEVEGIPMSESYWCIHSEEYIAFLLPEEY